MIPCKRCGAWCSGKLDGYCGKCYGQAPAIPAIHDEDGDGFEVKKAVGDYQKARKGRRRLNAPPDAPDPPSPSEKAPPEPTGSDRRLFNRWLVPTKITAEEIED
jgi:hypothetical protein